MDDWKIKYYAALIIALIIFMYVFFFVAAPHKDATIAFIDLLFAALVLFAANRYVSSKEPGRMTDINRTLLPQALLVIAIFSPIIILALYVKGILPILITGRLYILQVFLPGIILCAIVFILARKRLSGPVDYVQAIKYGAIAALGGASGPVVNAATFSEGTLILTEDGKMSVGDSMLFRTIGTSVVIAAFFIVLTLILIL